MQYNDTNNLTPIISSLSLTIKNLNNLEIFFITVFYADHSNGILFITLRSIVVS